MQSGEAATAGNSGRSVLYVVCWGALAVAAGVYLTVAIVKPRFVAEWFPGVDSVLTQPRSNDQNRSGIVAEAKQLRANLEQSQAEVSRLREELGSRDARVKSAELRISGLEKELAAVHGQGARVETGSTVGGVAAATQGTGEGDATKRGLAGAIGSPTENATINGGTDAKTNVSPRSFEIVNGAPTLVDAAGGQPNFANASPGSEVLMPLPGRRPAIAVKPKASPIAQIVRPTVAIAAPADSGIETGSVGVQARQSETTAEEKSAPTITFGAPVVTRSATPVGLRLTAAPSVDALRLSWSLMSERYAYELGGLEPRYVAGNTPAAPYALVAGPIADEAEAQRRCALLITRGIPCSIDRFNGNAL